MGLGTRSEIVGGSFEELGLLVVHMVFSLIDLVHLDCFHLRLPNNNSEQLLLLHPYLLGEFIHDIF